MAAFAVTGLLILGFLAGPRTQFRGRVSGAVATGALALVGASFLVSVFPTALPGEDTNTLPNLLHGLGFVGCPPRVLVGYVATGLALRRNPDWRGWWVYALATAPVAVAVMILGISELAWYAFLVLVMGWFGVLGVRLLQIARR